MLTLAESQKPHPSKKRRGGLLTTCRRMPRGRISRGWSLSGSVWKKESPTWMPASRGPVTRSETNSASRSECCLVEQGATISCQYPYAIFYATSFGTIHHHLGYASLNDLIRNLRMARTRIGLHRLQCRFFVVPVLENPVVETRSNKFQRDFSAASVFPKPTMDSRAGRDECAVGLICPHFVVEFISLVVVRALLTGGLDIRFSMEFKEQRFARDPRVNQARALFHVVFDFHTFTGCEFDFTGIDLVPVRPCDERIVNLRRSSV